MRYRAETMDCMATMAKTVPQTSPPSPNFNTLSLPKQSKTGFQGVQARKRCPVLLRGLEVNFGGGLTP